MSELTHLVKQDSTTRSVASATPTEVTQYTISWSDLTGAGFAASDVVLLLVMAKLTANNANGNVVFTIGLGTTYAGRADIAESNARQEPAAANAFANTPYTFLDQRTLVVNENIYFSLSSPANTGVSDDFHVMILKVGGTGGLGTNDLIYAENTGSAGDAPTAYDTNGAAVTTPTEGDWLFIATTHWLVDDITADMFTAIAVDGVDTSEVRSEGEDTADEVCQGTIAYAAGLAGSKVARVRYMTDEATTQDVNKTSIVGIRLNAFKDHVGVQSANTITHSIVDTFQEVWGPSYTASQTGNVIAIFYPIHDWNTASTPESSKRPYGRIQLAGADWPAAGANAAPVGDNGNNAIGGPILFGRASVSSGTLDFDFDAAEDVDISPTYACDVQAGAIFSLELAPTATPASDNQIAYLKGKSTALDNQIAYLQGAGPTTTDSTPAYLKGRTTATDNQAAFISGTNQYIEKVRGIQSSALIAYWPLAELVGTLIEDFSSQGNDALYKESPTLGETGIGDGLTSVLFDGSADWAWLWSSGLSADFDGKEGTILVWIKVSGSGIWTDGLIHNIITFHASNDDQLQIEKHSNNNLLRSIYRAGGVSRINSASGISDTDWICVALTWSFSADEIKLYVDGSQAGSTTTIPGEWTAAIDEGADPFKENRLAYHGGNYWSGWEAHVAVWNTPLGSSDIADLATIGEKSSKPAFLKGQSTASSSQDAYLAGGNSANSSQDAFTKGQTSTADNQTAYLRGQDSSSSQQSAFLAGAFSALDSQPAYTKGQTSAVDNQLAFLQGSDSASSQQTAFLSGVFTAQDTQAAFLSGQASTQDNQPAFVAGVSVLSSNQPAFLAGLAQTTSAQSAYTKGSSPDQSFVPAFLRGGVVATDSQPAFLEGGGLSVLDAQPAYLKGQSSASASQESFTAGQVSVTSSKGAFLVGAQPTVGSAPAYLSGQTSITSSQDGFTSGRSSVTDNHAAYLSGQTSSQDTQPAFLEGGQPISGSLDAFLDAAGEWLYPDGDLSQSGSWKKEDLATENLYQSIDEPVINDADYVWYESVGVGEYFEVSLSNPSGIMAEGEVSVFWRARRRTGSQSVTLRIELREGANVRASQSQVLVDPDTTYKYTLTAGEKSSITDWTDVRLRFVVEAVS
jgi:hypothetical protein